MARRHRDSVRCGQMSQFTSIDGGDSVAGAEDRGVFEFLGFVCVGAAEERRNGEKLYLYVVIIKLRNS